MADPVAELRASIDAAVAAVAEGASANGITLERPPKAEMGDYSTNAAMMVAGAIGVNPREVAERLRAILAERLAGSADRLEIAGPGFLNLHLTDRWHRDAVAAILEAGAAYGRVEPETPERGSSSSSSRPIRRAR